MSAASSKRRAQVGTHPSRQTSGQPAAPRSKRRFGTLQIPRNQTDWETEVDGRPLRLTNLQKLFWPKLGITKRDLLQYYADVAPVLLPHLINRAMVMKRFPNGADGEFFFMKHAPTPRPVWLQICSIDHVSGNVVDFPIVQDLAALLF